MRVSWVPGPVDGGYVITGDLRVRVVLSFLAQGWSERCSVPALALAANLSERRLWAVFRRETGATLRECIQRKRMEKAADLLCSTALIVKQVTFAVGYSAPSNFDRDFRRCYGMSPKEYRRAYSAPPVWGEPFGGPTRGATVE